MTLTTCILPDDWDGFNYWKFHHPSRDTASSALMGTHWPDPAYHTITSPVVVTVLYHKRSWTTVTLPPPPMSTTMIPNCYTLTTNNNNNNKKQRRIRNMRSSMDGIGVSCALRVPTFGMALIWRPIMWRQSPTDPSSGCCVNPSMPWAYHDCKLTLFIIIIVIIRPLQIPRHRLRPVTMKRTIIHNMWLVGSQNF